MKIISAISLSVLLLFAVGKDLSIYVDYYMNKKEITENVCVNRYEEMIMCFGQCYIDSRFIQSFESQDEAANPMQLTQGLLYVVPTKIELNTPYKEKRIIYKNFDTPQNVIDSIWSKSIFRPPIS